MKTKNRDIGMLIAVIVVALLIALPLVSIIMGSAVGGVTCGQSGVCVP